MTEPRSSAPHASRRRTAGAAFQRETGADPPLDPPADAWLVDKARHGDADAYEVLVRRHRNRIYRVALRMLGNPEDAEDVAQDAIIQAWVALAGFLGNSSFSTWLYRIVVNRCLKVLKRRRPDTDLLDTEQPSAAPGPEDELIARERARATARALSTLPTDQLSVIVLYQIEGLSYREVAEILNISEGAVRGRLARARRALLHQLREWA